MKNFSLPTVMLIGLLGACQNQKTTPTAPPSVKTPMTLTDYKVAGDSLIIPTFEIEVKTSEKSAQKLKADKETIIVAAFFSGDPTDDKLRDDDGRMYIANKNVELTAENRIARFENVKFSKKQYDALADKDFELLINVYSGRKSGEDNLLDCGIVDKKVSELKGQKFVVDCQLIGEK